MKSRILNSLCFNDAKPGKHEHFCLSWTIAVFQITFNLVLINRHNTAEIVISGEPGIVDRVLALHAGSRVFDSHRGHMSERFFRSNRPGYPHPVSSELENSHQSGGWCGVRFIIPTKLCMCTQNTTNTMRTDTRRRVCAAMVPYR